MKTLARKPKTVRTLTEEEAMLCASKLSLAVQLIRMAQMTMHDEVGTLTYEWKKYFNELYNAANHCEKIINTLSEEHDDLLHEVCAEGTEVIMRFLEDKAQQHQQS